MKKKPDGIYRSSYTKQYYYVLNGKKSEDWPDKVDVAKDYIHAYLNANPSKKPLAVGKTWKEVFSLFNITL